MALYYWVGGTNTWTSAAQTGRWSNAPGGSVFYAVNPGVGDDVFFDGASGAVTVTLATAQTVGTINFTGFTGTFIFAANLSAGDTTLGASTTYTASGGNPTTYTFIPRNVPSTFTANGKILPTNLFISLNGTTLTFAGNADFGGNLSTTTTAHNIKAAIGTVDLRIGGNIAISAMATNAADHVTIKGYGTSKTFSSGGGLNLNMRVSFVNGSVYTSSANSSSAGTSFLTIEAGGKFNSTHIWGNTGTVTLSGFNSINNNSSFFGLQGASGTMVLSTDTIIPSLQTSTQTLTVQSSPASSKLLLTGNFAIIGSATTIIDRLEFSGTSASDITGNMSTGLFLQVKDFIINKTGAGSVNFNSQGNFSLFIPNSTTYSWTHTSGTVTQSLNCNIIIQGGNATSQFNYSAPSVTPFVFRNLALNNGTISLNSILRATTLKINPIATNMILTSSGTFGFITDELFVTNASVSIRTITLKSATTYEINTFLVMSNIGGSRITLTASLLSPSPRAIFNLSTSAICNVEFVDPINIDSSGTGGALPYTKQLIYSQNGVLTTTINWSNTSQPPPVGAKVTVGYTFVN